MRARKVKGLDPEAALADNAARIVRIRLDELYSFLPAALDPAEGETLHHMRIAAKRLRYVLELTSPCFGPYATQAVKHVRQIQDLVGEIHDCDVMLPLILDHVAALRAQDAAAVAGSVGTVEELGAGATERTAHRMAYRPLELLAVHQQARRQLCFERFVADWESLQRSGFYKRLRQALRERPATPREGIAATGSSPNGSMAATGLASG